MEKEERNTRDYNINATLVLKQFFNIKILLCKNLLVLSFSPSEENDLGPHILTVQSSDTEAIIW